MGDGGSKHRRKQVKILMAGEALGGHFKTGMRGRLKTGMESGLRQFCFTCRSGFGKRIAVTC